MDTSSAIPGSTATNLLEQAKANEGAAWQRLAALYTPLVYSWARRASLQAEDAADVVQEVFCAVHKHLTDYEHHSHQGSFRAWLWTITRNKINDHWRRLARQPQGAGGTDAQRYLKQMPDIDLQSPDEPPSPKGSILRRALELIHSEFEERSWNAFWRVTVAGQSAAAVAADLGMSTNAVYVARSRVLARLRQELTDDSIQ